MCVFYSSIEQERVKDTGHSAFTVDAVNVLLEPLKTA